MDLNDLNALSVKMYERKRAMISCSFFVSLHDEKLTNMINDQFRVRENIYATKGERIGNYIIDRIIFTVGIFLFGMLLGMFLAAIDDVTLLYELENINPIIDYILSGIFFAFYYILLEGSMQKSFGKMITKTIVVDEFGNKPKMSAIVGRSFCRMIPFNALSFLGDHGRGWHDSIPNTYVVSVQKLENAKKLHNSLKTLGSDNESSEFVNKGSQAI